MKKLNLIAIAVVTLFTTSTVQAQKLGKFNSSITKKVGPKTVAVPYTDVTSYLGFATPGSEDEIKEGKKFYYIYVWIPAVAPELGVRMMSPVGSTKVKKPIVAADYEANKDSKDFFDTYITLEKSNIYTVDKISEASVKDAKWTTLAKNDDNGEMPKDPKGRKYNSLLRYESDLNDPLKSLSVGLYRVGFTTYKRGEVSGTFLAEVGAPVALPGVGVAKTIEELLAQISK